MGKDRIRSNALKHGLTARLTLWQNEDTGQFQNLLLALLEQFEPTSDVEFLCIEEMAMAKWRLRRVVSLETAAGNKHLGETTATGGAGTLAAYTAAQQAGQLLTTLRQHEAAYSRAYQRAYKHLRQLRQQFKIPRRMPGSRIARWCSSSASPNAVAQPANQSAGTPVAPSV